MGEEEEGDCWGDSAGENGLVEAFDEVGEDGV